MKPIGALTLMIGKSSAMITAMVAVRQEPVQMQLGWGQLGLLVLRLVPRQGLESLVGLVQGYQLGLTETIAVLPPWPASRRAACVVRRHSRLRIARHGSHDRLVAVVMA